MNAEQKETFGLCMQILIVCMIFGLLGFKLGEVMGEIRGAAKCFVVMK